MYDIWVEGYAASGDRGVAQRVCTVEADTFSDACIKANKSGKFQGFGTFDPERLTIWGCHLYPTKAEAKKSFG